MKRRSYFRKKRRQKWVKISVLTLVGFVCAMAVGLLSLRIYAQIAGAPPLIIPKASVFLDSHGNKIGDYYKEERRYWIELEDMSPYLKEATIAVEDKDFYSHHGFDLSRIASAIIKDIKTQSKAEGASTITQQLARNLYLTLDKTWSRKINEALYAYRLEIFYSKEEIIEGYLNTVNYGHGMYGVEAASQYYFSKSARDLTLAESAMLAGIPKGPSIYSPIINIEKASNRQKLILRLMEDQQMISATEKDRALSEQIVLKNDQWIASHSIAPYFLDTVWQEATQILEQKGINIREGGLTIKTTLNKAHQQAAEAAIENHLPEDDLQIGFVSMDVDRGFVTSMVGGRDYRISPYNRVTQAARQPGSTIKPILYTAALENGFSPLTYLDVSETIFTYDDGRSTYQPKNVNGKFADNAMSLAQAIAISDNIYAVKTLQQIGHNDFRDMLKRFNLSYSEGDNPSAALGTIETSLYDLTNAYNIIAAYGQKRNPTTIISITNAQGELVYEYSPTTSEQVISEQDAFMMTQLMTGMFDPVFNDYSPATGVSLRQRMTHTYAAKSGSTVSDQWLVGYTPSITAGVWNGYDEGKTLAGQGVTSVTKQVWIEFMEAVHQGTENESFQPPSGVEGVIVDIDSGKIATDACPKQRLVYVKSEDVPTEKCSIFENGDWDQFFNLFDLEGFTNIFGS